MVLAKKLNLAHGTLRQSQAAFRFCQCKFARECHLSSPWMGGDFICIVPVVHPCEHDSPAILSRNIGPGLGRVEISAEVYPQCPVRGSVINKFVAIEVANEVLRRGTLRGAAIANAHYNDPFLPALGISKREEVGALPITNIRRARRSEFTRQVPRLQIGRRIKTNAMLFSHGYDHDPTRSRRIPENHGIAKFSLMDIENWILGIFR